VPTLLKPTVLLMIPTVALSLLSWFGLGMASRAAGACADWARDYRDARDNLTAVVQLWQAGYYRSPDREEYEQRVRLLAAARPARCDVSGRLR
jgi:hypothetical protein